MSRSAPPLPPPAKPTSPGRPRRLGGSLRESEVAKAAGMAGAMMAANVMALGLTIVFARLLGAAGYGSLAAVVSGFLILAVGGNALQVATARAGALGELGAGAAQAATLSRWLRGLAVLGLGVAVAAAVLRAPLASLVGVREDWAAAAIPPTAVAWLALCVQRGALQGLHAFRAVGLSLIFEQVGRLGAGAALVVAGLGVTGAFLGATLGMLATSLLLARSLRRRLAPPGGPDAPPRAGRFVAGGHAGPRLGRFALRQGTPITALALIAFLQQIDVIVAKHQLSGAQAGSYAAAAVAAKVVMWVAVGVGFYLVPRATRTAASGGDARAILGRALGVLGVVAIPALLLFALAPATLLRIAFGAHLTGAAGALLLLGAAMTLLAAAYLAVQYLLALGRVAFLAGLAVLAVAEPIALLLIAAGPVAFATAALGVQAVAAAAMLALALTAHRRMRPASGVPASAVGGNGRLA